MHTKSYKDFREFVNFTFRTLFMVHLDLCLKLEEYFLFSGFAPLPPTVHQVLVLGVGVKENERLLELLQPGRGSETNSV